MSKNEKRFTITETTRNDAITVIKSSITKFTFEDIEHLLMSLTNAAPFLEKEESPKSPKELKKGE